MLKNKCGCRNSLPIIFAILFLTNIERYECRNPLDELFLNANLFFRKGIKWVLFLIFLHCYAFCLESKPATNAIFEPRIHIGTSGHIVTAWQTLYQERYIVQASTYNKEKKQWSRFTDLSKPDENANYPNVAINSFGNAIVVWQTRHEGKQMIQASMYDQARDEWSEPIDVSDCHQNSIFPQVSINSFGNAIVVWQTRHGRKYTIQSSMYDKTKERWSEPIDVSDCHQNSIFPQVSINLIGDAIAVWQKCDKRNYVIQTSVYDHARGKWSNPIEISDSCQNANSPQISIDLTGKGIAVWGVIGKSSHIIQAAIYNKAKEQWSEPVALSNCLQDSIFPQIHTSAFGSTTAIWQQFNEEGYVIQGAVYDKKRKQWEPPSDISDSFRDSMTFSINNNLSGNATVVWQQFNGKNYIFQSAIYNQVEKTWDADCDWKINGERP